MFKMLTTVENWGHLLLKLCRWNSFPFMLDVRLQLLNSAGLYYHSLLLILCHTFSMSDRSALQAGQSSTCTFLLQSHAVVTRAECGLALSCWNKHRRNKHLLLQNLYVPFSINGAFTDVQVTHYAMGTKTPPYHHRCWLWNCPFFLFGPEDTTFMIYKNNLKCELVRLQNTFPLCINSISKKLEPRQTSTVLGVVDIWLLLCMVEF